jgi:hypothetical protein
LEAALRDGGLDWGASEFLAGLHRALKNPDAEARGLRGEEVFADLRLDGGQEFSDALEGGASSG